MKQDQHHLSKVLNARETRFQLRNTFAKSGFDSLSLTLNIPGYPKSNELLSNLFTQILDDLLIYLQANRIIIENKKEILRADEAGDFYLVQLKKNTQTNLQKIKQLTENFEEKHKLSRLIDVDIFNKDGVSISSGKEKPCYFCSEFSAISCMRNKWHSYTEISDKIFKETSLFLNERSKEKLIHNLCNFAQRALLYEISISNKPGLVCFEEPGVHTDMNFFTFLNSTSALTPYFKEFCELGYMYQEELNKVLPKIREIGLRAEKTMFLATNQANTHKGIIFLFGISLFSITKILSKNGTFSDSEFQKTVKKIGKDLVKNELQHLNGSKTHGEKVYHKYGKEGAGIRLEIETGLSTIFQTSLPYFSDQLKPDTYKDQTKLQEVLLQGLLLIMTINNDTNILYRSDLDTLNHIKELANRSLSNKSGYNQLYEFCKTNNLSPGGSADLLAVSLLLHFIKTEYNEF